MSKNINNETAKSLERLQKLSVLTEYMLKDIPNVESKKNIVHWLKSAPYSPYTTFYGGKKSKIFEKEKSFTSSIDGKLRYAIKDETTFKFENFIRIEDEFYFANTKLANIIKSEELFNAYPHLKDLEIKINISNAKNGSINGNTFYNEDTKIANKIEVYATTNEDAMTALIHEIQHCIQLKEDFAIGASYYNDKGVMDMFVSGVEKPQTKKQAQEIIEESAFFNPNIIKFQEVFNNPHYFEENKRGIKAKVIYLSPDEYMTAVRLKRPNHIESESKLDSIRLAMKSNVRLETPYLYYGSVDIDEESDLNTFGQEGYNRSFVAKELGAKEIPVFIRYRENDTNIPSFIKEKLNANTLNSFTDLLTKKVMKEIDDSKMEIKPLLLNSSNPTKDIVKIPLDDIIRHKELLNLYPELKEINVSVVSNDVLKGIDAVATNKTILLNEKILNEDIIKLKKALLHETQHIIQEIENWARGGNEKMFRDIDLNLKERAESIKKVEDYIQNVFENMDDKWKNAVRAINRNDNPQEVEEARKFIQNNPTYKLEYANYYNAHRDLKEIKTKDINENYKVYTAYEQYLNLYGEKQARITEKRFEEQLSMDERRAKEWSTEEENIFSLNKDQEPIVLYHSNMAHSLILEEAFLKDDGKVNQSNLAKVAGEYKTPHYTLEEFKKKFGVSNDVEKHMVKTPIGEVLVDLRVQYFKLKTWKENRVHLSGIIKETIENPLFIVRANGANKYYAPYKSKDGLTHIFSITETENGIDALKSNYKPFDMSRLKQLIKKEDESLLYVRSDIRSLLKSVTAQAHFDKLTKSETKNATNEILPNEDVKVNMQILDMPYTKDEISSYMQKEWVEEGLLSFFSMGYLKEKEEDNLRELFTQNALDFTELKKFDSTIFTMIDLYNGETLEELKVNTSYMNKHIDLIKTQIDNNVIMPPLLLLKDGKYEILGGRTRASIQRILGNKELNALVIEYDKMKQFFAPLKEKEFIQSGYDIFALESKKARQRTLYDLKYGTFDIEKIRVLDTFKELSDKEIKQILVDCCENIYGKDNMPQLMKEQLDTIDFEVMPIETQSQREDNFKKWFGDSKVVDINGEPLVVYHGTNATFDTFDKNKIGSRLNSDDKGFFFTGEIYLANDYGYNGNVMPVYLKMENPLSNKNIGEFYGAENIEEILEQYGYSENLMGWADNNKDRLNRIVEDERYDGIFFNTNDGQNLAVVFEPTQIKSIHNKGTFDINNPNILEKNDFGLRHIEKILSIIPNEINTETVHKYLHQNGLSHETLRGTAYQDCLNNPTFNNPIILDKSGVNYESDYFKNGGEIECRVIEKLYENSLDSISLEQLQQHLNSVLTHNLEQEILTENTLLPRNEQNIQPQVNTINRTM